MNSIWSESCRFKEREPISKSIKTEIAVIGAGITGLLTAFVLQNAGHHVVMLEARRIASGQTCHTTAKITSQHGLVYRRLITTLGHERAGQYLLLVEAAIGEVKTAPEGNMICCVKWQRNGFRPAVKSPAGLLRTA